MLFFTMQTKKYFHFHDFFVKNLIYFLFVFVYFELVNIIMSNSSVIEVMSPYIHRELQHVSGFKDINGFTYCEYLCNIVRNITPKLHNTKEICDMLSPMVKTEYDIINELDLDKPETITKWEIQILTETNTIRNFGYTVEEYK
jgi:hypothetical protein